ncbi:hypothetical protein KJ632_05050 [Patescibacteria group bacterium]|nr:hypothetical protein [Patescibacteria group bacterium]
MSDLEKTNIIVLEDELLVANFCKRALSTLLDVDVDKDLISVFKNTEEAKKGISDLIMSETLDSVRLILSDIDLPEKDEGLELYQELRAMPQLEKTPYILMSGRANENLLSQTLEEMKNKDALLRSLQKPFRVDAFIVILRSLSLIEDK